MPWFEDFTVGDRAAFGRYAVTAEEVAAFARAYDPQPFHLDEAAAAQTYFGRIAASGWQSCAFAMRMIVAEQDARDAIGGDAIGGDGAGSLGGLGVDALRWLKPVHPGDVLRLESEVLEVRASASRPDRGTVRSRLTMFNQHDEAVMQFEPTVLYRRRAA